MTEKCQKKRVAIIGGGLVGALNACFLSNRGFVVDLYESRQDIRTVSVAKGRSINLALSQRGIEALQAVGLDQVVLEKAIVMKARMVHGLDWSRKPIPYGTEKQGINSVDRRLLNEVLLTAAEYKSDVTMFFEHRLISIDFDTNKMLFRRSDQTQVTYTADVIIGCDGAYSETRRQFMKSVRFDYEQKYIEHGYMELIIPPTADNQFAMEKNYLHLWPRNEYMMIALPNLDHSYTTTLFMPFTIFESLKTDEQLLEFFKRNFPDAIDLIKEDNLKQTFFSCKPLPLITLKCSPYHIRDCAVLMGDAAHAMIPFYGQGMNTGFEDCLIFDNILQEHNNNVGSALAAFTAYRRVDAGAICDLAHYNYLEMRSSVNSPWFFVRKKMDNFLHRIFPTFWVPLYTMVSFTRIRFSDCVLYRRRQDKILHYMMVLPSASFAIFIALCAVRYRSAAMDLFSQLWR